MRRSAVPWSTEPRCYACGYHVRCSAAFGVIFPVLYPLYTRSGAPTARGDAHRKRTAGPGCAVTGTADFGWSFGSSVRSAVSDSPLHHARTAFQCDTDTLRPPTTRDASPNRRPPYPTCTWHATEPQLDVRAHPDHYPTMSNLLARARPQGEWTHGEWTHGKCGWFARSTENSIKRGPTSHRGCV